MPRRTIALVITPRRRTYDHEQQRDHQQHAHRSLLAPAFAVPAVTRRKPIAAALHSAVTTSQPRTASVSTNSLPASCTVEAVRANARTDNAPRCINDSPVPAFGPRASAAVTRIEAARRLRCSPGEEGRRVRHERDRGQSSSRILPAVQCGTRSRRIIAGRSRHHVVEVLRRAARCGSRRTQGEDDRPGELVAQEEKEMLKRRRLAVRRLLDRQAGSRAADPRTARGVGRRQAVTDQQHVNDPPLRPTAAFGRRRRQPSRPGRRPSRCWRRRSARGRTRGAVALRSSASAVPDASGLRSTAALQNLPGLGEPGFQPAAACARRSRRSARHETVVVLHNDTVVQGLSRIPVMQDVERWGILTIGTGLRQRPLHKPRGHRRKSERFTRRRSARCGAGAAHGDAPIRRFHVPADSNREPSTGIDSDDCVNAAHVRRHVVGAFRGVCAKRDRRRAASCEKNVSGRAASWSAFSWINRLAEVWRSNSVSSPRCARAARSSRLRRRP